MDKHITDTHLAVIGLGKLGSALLAVLSRHYQVVGMDADPKVRSNVGEGRCHPHEDQLQSLLAQHRSNYRFCAQVDEVLAGASVVFIVVPTPSKPDGSFDASQITSLCKQLGASKELKPHHLIVIVSTVMPGQTEAEILPALEHAGRKEGRDFSLCYNPSFIALGSIVQNLTAPDMVLIGERDPQAGARVERIHQALCANMPPVMRMHFINAEITKLALNSFITTKITYANMIARLCEKLPQADAQAVLGAIGIDKRIGNACLKGGIGYGGPCFPRDNMALAAVGHQAGSDTSLAESVHRFNENQPAYVYDLIARLLHPGERVGMLGITYKPGTHVTEQSQALAILMRLSQSHEAGFYDPAAQENGLRRFDSAQACIGGSDVIIIGTAWPEFDVLHETLNASAVRCVVDFWSVISPTALRPDIMLVRLGKALS